jgi:hypothetical protein
MLDTSFASGIKIYENIDSVSTKLFFTYVCLSIISLIQEFVQSSFSPEFQKHLNRLLYDSLTKQEVYFYDGKLNKVLLSSVENDVDNLLRLLRID